MIGSSGSLLVRSRAQGRQCRAYDAGAGSTSTWASNAACPALNEKASTAESGRHGAPEVRRLIPLQPSRIQTVPDVILPVTRAQAFISPRRLKIRMVLSLVMPRAAASSAEIHKVGRPPRRLNVGSA